MHCYIVFHLRQRRTMNCNANSASAELCVISANMNWVLSVVSASVELCAYSVVYTSVELHMLCIWQQILCI